MKNNITEEDLDISTEAFKTKFVSSFVDFILNSFGHDCFSFEKSLLKAPFREDMGVGNPSQSLVHKSMNYGFERNKLDRYFNTTNSDVDLKTFNLYCENLDAIKKGFLVKLNEPIEGEEESSRLEKKEILENLEEIFSVLEGLSNSDFRDRPLDIHTIKNINYKKNLEGPHPHSLSVIKFYDNKFFYGEIGKLRKIDEERLLPCDEGVLTFSNGSRYRGHLESEKPNGKGVFTIPDGFKYCGDFKNGKAEGYGFCIYPDGSKYKGEFVGGTSNGKGVLISSDGLKYRGDFKNGKAEGYGFCIYSDGSKYKGEFVGGKENGKGVFTMPDGFKYCGDFKNGKAEGYGFCYAPQKSIQI